MERHAMMDGWTGMHWVQTGALGADWGNGCRLGQWVQTGAMGAGLGWVPWEAPPPPSETPAACLASSACTHTAPVLCQVISSGAAQRCRGPLLGWGPSGVSWTPAPPYVYVVISTRRDVKDSAHTNTPCTGHTNTPCNGAHIAPCTHGHPASHMGPARAPCALAQPGFDTTLTCDMAAEGASGSSTGARSSQCG